jgi:alpha-glucoside transport system permease protein
MVLSKAAAPALPRLVVRALGRVPVHVTIAAVCCLWLVPTVALLVSSFRPPNLVATSGWWTAFRLPLAFTVENYAAVLTTYNMAPSFVNSLLITVPATVIPLLIAAYAAYAFAWMSFPGRDWLFLAVVGLLVVPLQTTFIPVLTLFVQLGLTGTFLGLWLAHTGYGLPLAIYLLRNFIGSLPRDIFESALIDGAGHWTVFFRIVLPTSVAALASLAIFQFLWVWNDLLVALIYLGGQPDVAPVTVTISNLVNSLGQGWQLLTAAAFISMALPLAVFFSLQRYFARGLLAGALKG